MEEIKKATVGFFEEEDGVKSAVRLFTFMIILQALFTATYRVIVLPTHTFDMVGVSSLLTIALGGKVTQKAFEK